MSEKKMGEDKTYFRDEDGGFRDKDGNRISEKNVRIEFRIQKHNEAVKKGMTKIPFNSDPDTYNSIKNGEYENPDREAYLQGYAASPTDTQNTHEIKFKQLQDSLERQFGNLNKKFSKLDSDKVASWPEDLRRRVWAGLKSDEFYNEQAKPGMEIVGLHPETYKYVEKENRRIANINKSIENYLHKKTLN